MHELPPESRNTFHNISANFSHSGDNMPKKKTHRTEESLDPAIWAIRAQSRIPNKSTYGCLLCRSKAMVLTSVDKHERLPDHIRRLEERQLALQNVDAPVEPGVHEATGSSIAAPDDWTAAEWQGIHVPERVDPDLADHMAALLALESDGSAPPSDDASEVTESVLYPDSEPDNNWDGMDGVELGEFDEHGMPTLAMVDRMDRRPTGGRPEQDSTWWPYRSQLYLLASLIIGYAQTIMSRSLYDHIRWTYKTCRLVLPDWSTVRRSKSKLRKMIGLEVQEAKSILQTPLFHLSLKNVLAQELANPLVRPKIEFYPEQSHGKNVYKLSQSRKWLEELGESDRAPMVRSGGTDYYLFEPVQLPSNEIVVPLFFYSEGGELVAKCVKPELFDTGNDTNPLTITIRKHLSFNSSEVADVPVSTFHKAYDQITYRDGLLLSTMCNHQMLERQWTIAAKKEHASASDAQFLKDINNQDDVYRDLLFNPFFELSVQRTMGYNALLLTEQGHQEPQVGSRKVQPNTRVAPPADLSEFLRGYELNQVGEIDLNQKDKIVAGTFVLFRLPGPVAAIGIARVEHLWEARSGTSVQMYLSLSLFAKGQVDDFYGMRTIRRTGRRKFVGIECIAACINVQHNCHRGNCAISWTRGVQVERRDTNIRVAEMAHVDDDDYIVNGASLSSVDAQRAFSDNPCKEITNQQQLTALHKGIAKWHALETPAGPSGEFSALDPALL
ncbi:hypothetical protein MJO29_016833 [Puccinia striiformis f. sp. tritici]|nr:hypothetical protein MJO29_016833 [Puccinia striiformis f. sp. tritici]